MRGARRRPDRAPPERIVRLWLVGFGTVGRWLARALSLRARDLERRYGVRFVVVGLANRRDGFVHRDDGLDLRAAIELVESGGSLHDLPGTDHWRTALQGLRATTADVLVEVSSSPLPDAEPGCSHLEEVLGRGIDAVTSNKWPVAIHGVRLGELARASSAELRAEATVMSGTPVLSALIEGLAGASPRGIRGIVNATANQILSEMARGRRYEDALADAQSVGLAERDPSADVDGYDAVAKAMVVAALVFGYRLRIEDIVRRGISSVDEEAVATASAQGLVIREVTTVERPAGEEALRARVEPVALATDDPLARVDGTDNALICTASPLGEVTVIGPGAGVELAGQGVLSDLLSLAQRPRVGEWRRAEASGGCRTPCGGFGA